MSNVAPVTSAIVAHFSDLPPPPPPQESALLRFYADRAADSSLGRYSLVLFLYYACVRRIPYFV